MRKISLSFLLLMLVCSCKNSSRIDCPSGQVDVGGVCKQICSTTCSNPKECCYNSVCLPCGDTPDLCKQYSTLENCNSHPPECAWYACVGAQNPPACRPTGTSIEAVCGLCEVFQDLAACDAAKHCDWYACAEDFKVPACRVKDTPINEVCDCKKLSLESDCSATTSCRWVVCDGPEGTSQCLGKYESAEPYCGSCGLFAFQDECGSHSYCRWFPCTNPEGGTACQSDTRRFWQACGPCTRHEDNCPFMGAYCINVDCAAAIGEPTCWPSNSVESRVCDQCKPNPDENACRSFGGCSWYACAPSNGCAGCQTTGTDIPYACNYRCENLISKTECGGPDFPGCKWFECAENLDWPSPCRPGYVTEAEACPP